MELSIGQVAKRVGVSARMLRHYDDLGIYKPSRISRNGYRWYDESTLPRLYRTVALRRAGVGLAEIAQIVQDGSDEAEALRSQLHDLQNEQARLTALIAAVEQQIEHLERARIDDPAEFRSNYREELSALIERLKQQHPAPFVDSYASHTSAIESMSIAELEHLVATSARMMSKLASLVENGTAPESVEARNGIAEHYAMLTQSVPLSLNAYRSLGRAYIDDPLQNSIAHTFHPKLPRWLCEAIDRYVANQPAA